MHDVAGRDQPLRDERAHELILLEDDDDGSHAGITRAAGCAAISPPLQL
jgi:hypothetical protein